MKVNIIYSSSLLRQIRLLPEGTGVSIDLWVGHVIADGNQFYTYTEGLHLLPSKSSYLSNQPRLVKTKGNQQQVAIRKINWAALRKNYQGYTTVMELDGCLLRHLSQKAFVSLQEDIKEAVLMLKDDLLSKVIEQ